MANTTIQLRYSTETGNVPVSLANGEIAINTQDGKLFYADPTGTVQEFSGFPGPSGLNGEIQFNDSGSLGANSLLSFNKTIPALNVGGVSLTNTYIQFGDGTKQYTANAGSGGGGSGGVTIVLDAFSGTGACTNFTLSVTPTNENYTVVTVNGVTQAKTTYSLSNSTVIFSEAPPDTSEIEVLSFVTLGSSSLLAYDEEFSGTGACTTFTLTQTPTSENYTIVSIDGVVQHKSTYSLTGSDVIFSEAPLNGSTIDVNYYITSALADTALITYAANHANAAFDAANNATDTYVRAHANAAFDAANTNASDIVVIQGVNLTQNTSISNLQGVNLTQNTNITSATNTGIAAFNHSNAAFDLANTINSNYATQLFVNTAIADLVNTAPSTLDTLNELAAALNNDPNFAATTVSLIGSSFTQANAAFDTANTNASNITVIQGVDLTQNTSITNLEGVNLTQNTNISNLEGVNLTQNTSITNIQGVDDSQNTSISNLEGVNLTQNTSITNIQGVDNTQNTNITTAQNTADASFIHANAAFDAANTNASDIVIIQGVDNTQNTSISNLEGVNLTQNTSISNLQGVDLTQNANITIATNTGTAAFIHANAAFDAANNNVGGNSFGVIFASNNSVYANASSATDQVLFTGVNGVEVTANATTKEITFAGIPGLQGLSVDYGSVTESLVYSLDYGSL